ncbi:MAG: hypothetical protein ACREMQ_02000 [Longimicrobiales bacterium]
MVKVQMPEAVDVLRLEAADFEVFAPMHGGQGARRLRHRHARDWTEPLSAHVPPQC